MRWFVVSMATLLFIIGCGSSDNDAGHAASIPAQDTPAPATATAIPASPHATGTEDETAATSTATDTPASPEVSTPTATATGTIVWPTLTELQPAEAVPNQEVQVIGTGGYVRIPGGYIESLRWFDLTLDGQPIGEISCYIHLCGGSFEVPAALAPGSYVVATEGGSQLTLTVLAR